MRSAIRAAAVGAMATAVFVTPRPAVAQGDTPCVAALDNAARARQRDFGGGRYRHYLGGDVRAHCEGQDTRMRSDSVAWLEDMQQFHMVGRVAFRDTTVSLDADTAIYYLNDERLLAFGNVRLENLSSGTVLEGPVLTYWREVPSLRDTTELFAERRPTVTYRAVGDTTDPYIIVSDRVRLKGEDLAWAGGSVTIDRRDFHAKADSTVLDLGTNAGELIEQASVNGGEDSTGFRLTGRTIGFRSENNAINWVQARDSAEAESEEFWILADTVEFTIANDQVQGGFAWGDSIRPYAIAQTNRITADSLAIDSPNQVLEELRGFGTARAVSMRGVFDEEGDWIAGDRLVAQFVMAPSGERRMIDTLVATGSAVALYRIYPEEDSPLFDINYSRGDTITVSFTEAGLQRVDVVGNADGLHLEAVQRRRRP